MILQLRLLSAFPIFPGWAGRCRPLALGTWAWQTSEPKLLGFLCWATEMLAWQLVGAVVKHTNCLLSTLQQKDMEQPTSVAQPLGAAVAPFPSLRTRGWKGASVQRREERTGSDALAREMLTSFSCMTWVNSLFCPFYASSNFPGCVSPFKVFSWTEWECSGQMWVFGLVSPGSEWVKPDAVQEKSQFCYSAFAKILWLCCVNYVVFQEGPLTRAFG